MISGCIEDIQDCLAFNAEKVHGARFVQDDKIVLFLLVIFPELNLSVSVFR